HYYTTPTSYPLLYVCLEKFYNTFMTSKDPIAPDLKDINIASKKRFVHLHTHSHYSLLQALPKIPDLIKKAKESGMDALAITDNGNMYATIEFIKEVDGKDIKPIIGVDFFVAVRTRHDREPRI